MNKYGLAISVMLMGAFATTQTFTPAISKAKPTLIAEKPSISINDPDKFMIKYYDTVKSAKKLSELVPFYRKEQVADMDKMRSEVPKGMDMDKMMLGMMQEEQPKAVKIIEKKVEKDRVIYKLEPKTLPPDKAALKAKGNFTMEGELILVKEDGNWKVYKDYWKSKTKDKNGSFSSAFGINPDKKKDRQTASNNAAPTKPEDFDSQFRDVFFKDWKPGKDTGSVYAALKLGEDGSLIESHFKSKKEGQQKAVQTIKNFVTSKSLPKLPAEYKEKPYVWMLFSWSDKGSRAISGPYFDKSFPSWVVEK